MKINVLKCRIQGRDAGSLIDMLRALSVLASVQQRLADLMRMQMKSTQRARYILYETAHAQEGRTDSRRPSCDVGTLDQRR